MQQKIFQEQTELTSPQLAVLNIEAGAHQIPDDPRELAAVVTAGEHTLKYFPYLVARYGDRGRRFTASDSAWLATLVKLEQPVLDQQVLWLGRVLAARGLPRMVLEVHLNYLLWELSAATSINHSVYQKLGVAANNLRAKRFEKVAENQFDLIVQEFNAAVDPTQENMLVHMGELLVAAVTDEKDGLLGVATNIVDWMSGSSCFSAHGLKAANNAIARARGL